MLPTIGIIVPMKGDLEHLTKCLEFIEKYTLSKYHLVIVSYEKGVQTSISPHDGNANITWVKSGVSMGDGMESARKLLVKQHPLFVYIVSSEVRVSRNWDWYLEEIALNAPRDWVGVESYSVRWDGRDSSFVFSNPAKSEITYDSGNNYQRLSKFDFTCVLLNPKVVQGTPSFKLDLNKFWKEKFDLVFYRTRNVEVIKD